MFFIVILLSLTLFEPRILLVDHIQTPLSPDYLTVSTSFLYRCFYFHFFILYYFLFSSFFLLSLFKLKG